MEFKDIVEFIVEYAREALVFLGLLAILWGLFLEGGIADILALFGDSMLGA